MSHYVSWFNCGTFWDLLRKLCNFYLSFYANKFLECCSLLGTDLSYKVSRTYSFKFSTFLWPGFVFRSNVENFSLFLLLVVVDAETARLMVGLPELTTSILTGNAALSLRTPLFHCLFYTKW